MYGKIDKATRTAGDVLQWLAGHRVAVMGFCVAAGFWPTLLSPTYLPRWCAIAVLLPLCSRLDPREVPESLRWFFVWLLAVAFMATRWASPDPLGGYLEMMFFAMLGLAFIAGTNMESLDEVMKGLAAGLALSVFISLYQLSGASDEGRDGLFGAPPVGLFGNSEVFAEFAALIFVWATARRSLDFGVVAAVAALPLLLCQSRVALLAAGAGMLVAYGPRSKIRMAGLIGALVLGAVVMIFAFGQGKIADVDHRLTIWTATIFSWTQYGHGLGWFQASYPQEEFAHSDAVQAIAELGIGGFALLAFPFMAFTSNRGTNADKALFVAVCVEVALSFPLHLPASGFVAAVVAGRLVSRRALVCLGSDLVGHEDGLRHGRAETSGAGAFADGAGFGQPVSLRSVHAASTRLRGEVNRIDPAAAELERSAQAAWPRRGIQRA